MDTAAAWDGLLACDAHVAWHVSEWAGFQFHLLNFLLFYMM